MTLHNKQSRNTLASHWIPAVSHAEDEGKWIPKIFWRSMDPTDIVETPQRIVPLAHTLFARTKKTAVTRFDFYFSALKIIGHKKNIHSIHPGIRCMTLHTPQGSIDTHRAKKHGSGSTAV